MSLRTITRRVATNRVLDGVDSDASEEWIVNIAELGYLLVGAPDVEAWRHYAERVLGTMTSDGDNGILYLKIDPRAFRIAVLPGHANGLLASGWLVNTPAEFAAARQELLDVGVDVADGDEGGARLRHVQAYFTFRDPEGHSHEVAWGPISDFKPFTSPIGVSSFITEGMGVGHVVLTATNDFKAEAEFWLKHGFGLSDILNVPTPAGNAQVHFFHCRNPRQHSLALGELPIPGGCIHIMLEVATLDDVGRCLDRVEEHGVKLTATLGRHVNDNMTSFYMLTPGGFALEYGTGGKKMNWEENVVFETTRGSDWGHRYLS